MIETGPRTRPPLGSRHKRLDASRARPQPSAGPAVMNAGRTVPGLGVQGLGTIRKRNGQDASATKVRGGWKISRRALWDRRGSADMWVATRPAPRSRLSSVSNAKCSMRNGSGAGVMGNSWPLEHIPPGHGVLGVHGFPISRTIAPVRSSRSKAAKGPVTDSRFHST
jgi:hypothetical protein